jgi:hypothetical protein
MEPHDAADASIQRRAGQVAGAVALNLAHKLLSTQATDAHFGASNAQ